jgi:hypothetical protein
LVNGNYLGFINIYILPCAMNVTLGHNRAKIFDTGSSFSS